MHIQGQGREREVGTRRREEREKEIQNPKSTKLETAIYKQDPIYQQDKECPKWDKKSTRIPLSWFCVSHPLLDTGLSLGSIVNIPSENPLMECTFSFEK